jgi:methyl-accepting chemotaxis protein
MAKQHSANQTMVQAVQQADKVFTDVWSDQKDTIRSQMDWAQSLMGFATVVGIIAGLIFSWLITRTISRPLKRVIAGKVANLVEEIAVASREQAQGIEQLSTAVVEMDRVVQQAAANAQESASASEEMNAQADHLMVYVDDLVRLIDGDHEKPYGSKKYRQETGEHNLKDEMDAAVKNNAVKTPVMIKPAPLKPEQSIPFDDEEFKEF